MRTYYIQHVLVEQGSCIGYHPARADQNRDEQQTRATRKIESKPLSLWLSATFCAHSAVPVPSCTSHGDAIELVNVLFRSALIAANSRANLPIGDLAATVDPSR